MVALIEILAAFLFGVAASSNPCVLPLYPGFLAYLVSRSQRLTNRRAELMLGLLVLLGVIISMLVFGVVITLAKTSASSLLSYTAPAVDLFLIFMGVVLISGREPWSRLRTFSVPRVSNPFVEAFLYGALYGPITVPCNLPLLLAVVAFSATVFDLLGSLLVFFTFGLGFGLPLIVLSVAVKVQRDWVIHQLRIRHREINILAVLTLIGIGVYECICRPQYLGMFT